MFRSFRRQPPNSPSDLLCASQIATPPPHTRRAVPIAQARDHLIPGAPALLTTRSRGRDNVMALGWHTLVEPDPTLISCVLARTSRSHEMLRESGECVINLPPEAMRGSRTPDGRTGAFDEVIAACGRMSGHRGDKFSRLGLERCASRKVAAPSLPQCRASLECRLKDDRAVERYNLFILEIVHIEVEHAGHEAPPFAPAWHAPPATQGVDFTLSCLS